MTIQERGELDFLRERVEHLENQIDRIIAAMNYMQKHLEIVDAELDIHHEQIH